MFSGYSFSFLFSKKVYNIRLQLLSGIMKSSRSAIKDICTQIQYPQKMRPLMKTRRYERKHDLYE